MSGSSSLVLVFLVSWLTFGLVTSWLASTKNRGAVAWFFIGVLLGPIALIAVGLAPSATSDGPDGESLGRWIVVSSETEDLVSGDVVGITYDDGDVVVWIRAGSNATLVEVAAAPLDEVAFGATDEGTRLDIESVTLVVRPQGSGGVNRLAAELAALSIRHRHSSRSDQGNDTPAEALRQLVELHDDGLVTDEEFAAKRQELLSRL